MKQIYFLGFLLILLFVIQRSCNDPTDDTEITADTLPNKPAKVKWIADGDTFWIENGTKEGLKIRLIGINAPEGHEYADRVEEYFGKEAEQYLSKLIKGKRIRLEYDFEKTDRYGRTLAYAFLEDSTFVNAEMIKNGYAEIMTIPPNIRYALKFAKLQANAKVKKLGMWQDSIPQPHIKH